MMKHTPGPWTAAFREGRAAAQYGHNVACHQHERPGVVAGCDSIAEVRGHSDDEARANARLIAAAPELRAALEEAVRTIERIDSERFKGCAWLAPWKALLERI